jgi:hypothetical protein
MTQARPRARANAEASRDAMMPVPATRFMTVVAQDPGLRQGKRGPILMAKVAIPAEDLTGGPLGYRVQVVDFDSSSQQFLGLHELPPTFEAEPKAWAAGSESILQDFRFHAQNVYALVMKTLARFEYALGRRVGWSFGTHQLKVAPHGMMDANAFYSPNEEGLVFGYFPASRRRGSGEQVIYTCLSHDIVVHETTHALIDGLRAHYLDPSSPDQAAFHEGFADVIAMLSVFSQSELVVRLLASSTGSGQFIPKAKVSAPALRESAVFELARQMGEELQGIRGAALRTSARLVEDPRLLENPEFLEPHRRGEILVAAIMHGFIEVWAARIKGASVPGQTQYPVKWVADEAVVIADALATMLIRALDYMPPVHITFSDLLSAAITADTEVRPDDARLELRRHILKAFRSFGIQPPPSAPNCVWERAPEGLSYDRVRFESMRSDRDEVFRFLWENRSALHLRDGPYTRVLSVRPCRRIGKDGFTLHETVAEYYQVARLTPEELAGQHIELPQAFVNEMKLQRQLRLKRRARKGTGADEEDRDSDGGPPLEGSEEELTTPIYGGGVLIFDEYGRLKFHVHTDIFSPDRQTQRLRYLWDSGQLGVMGDGARLRVARLSTVHRLRAIDANHYPAEGW